MKAEKVFYTYIKNICSCTQKDFESLMSVSKIVSYKKGDCILKAGEKFTSYYFLVNGCMRFHSWQNDKHITLRLIANPELTSDMLSIKTKKPAYNNLCAITDTTVIEINAVELEKLFSTSIEFELLGRKLTEIMFVNYMKRIHEFLFNSPEQNYINLLEKSPHVIQNISQQDIASYLGITPQSLSRIKSRIFMK